MHQTRLMYYPGMATAPLPMHASPPAFLRLAGDPLRWRLLAELARSDRRVRELTGLVGQPQNPVSYHLGRLRDGGLVTMRRSSADGRDTYYRLDLVAAGSCSPPPALRCTPAWAALRHPSPGRAGRRRSRVLFLCTGNSARSQIAEALLVRSSPAGGSRRPARAATPNPSTPTRSRVMRARRHRPDRCARQAPRRVHRAPLRLRDHPLRQGPRGLPRVPRPPGADPLEHPRPRRRRHRPKPATPRSATWPPTSHDAHRIPPPSHRTTRNRCERRPAVTGIDDNVVNVRYLVDDVQAALDFYTTHLGFTLRTAHLPAFADVTPRQPAAAAVRADQLGGPARCPTAGGRSRVAGTASTSSSPTSTRRGRPAARRRSRPSATTSSPARAASRSCSTTPPATRSNCSTPPAR